MIHPRNSVDIARSLWSLQWIMRGSRRSIKRLSIDGSAPPQQINDNCTMNGEGNDGQRQSANVVDEVARTATIIDKFPSFLFLFYFLLPTVILLAPLLCAIILLP